MVKYVVFPKEKQINKQRKGFEMDIGKGIVVFTHQNVEDVRFEN